ncbi:LPS export ABC transporter permease LptG [Frateuria aurantia]|uniref:Putative permease n=1 Tax=Frateuria aurantia (strain ATCC 33424 / DSM 6220 / KCTC 2777 / LMG 1558 / NBRC 3245 / NCIMB 13370) TaxID=767434 RepID=H8L698_FRAAD|nr:LPS export ABC transporter permease LptG [Frateuria aurantia]AFC86775.1 putative permease [Frateuria aurantia DSM 6220]
MKLDLSIKRVDRLIGITVLSSLLMTWLVLTGFDAVLQFLRQLGNVGKNGYTLSGAMLYVLVTLPRRLYQMFGNAALIGGLMGLGSLASTGELTALRAAGMSKLRIAASAVGVVTVLIVGVVILGETLAPWGDQQAQQMMARLKSRSLGATESGLWARDGARVINAKQAILVRHGDVQPEVELLDVRVFTLTPDGQISRFDHARIATHEGGQWVLKQVRSAVLGPAGVSSQETDREAWDSNLNPSVIEQSVIHPEYLPMRDLRRNMAYLEANGESPGVYASAFWGRAIYPFNVLVLVLCTMPFAFGALRSGGLGKRMFVGMLLAIAWYFLQQAIVSFGTVYGIPPLLANLLPAMALSGAAWLYFRRHS